MEKWIVRSIQEADYGCEERAENAPLMVLVTLTDEAGRERQVLAEDARLYELGVEEGGPWPAVLEEA